MWDVRCGIADFEIKESRSKQQICSLFAFTRLVTDLWIPDKRFALSGMTDSSEK